MSTIHPPRETVRPSRMRRAVARVVLIHDRADAWLNDRLTAVFGIMSTTSAVLAVSLMSWSLITRPSVGDRVAAVFTCALMLGLSAVLFAVAVAEHVANDERAKHRRTLARVMRERDEETQAAQNVEDALRADIATQRRALTDARFMLDTARDERDALAYVVSQLVSASDMTRETMRERVLDAWLSRHNDEHDDQHAVLAELSVLILRADENAYLAKYDA